MPEALQVDTQNLRGEGRCQSRWASGGDGRKLTDKLRPSPGHWTCMESIIHVRDLHMGANSPIFSSKDWTCLFPKNSGTGLGTLRRLSSTPSSHSLDLVSVPTTGDCTSHSYTAPLGSSASPKRRINSSSGTPVTTDPSVTIAGVAQAGLTAFCACAGQVSLHPAPQATHTPYPHRLQPNKARMAHSPQANIGLYSTSRRSEAYGGGHESLGQSLPNPARLAEGSPGKYKQEDSGTGKLGTGPEDNLLLTPLTAVHVVTCTGEQRARGQQG